MKVIAKFKVDEFKSTLQRKQIDPKGGWDTNNLETVEMRTIIMSPVYGNGDPNHENTKFWNASPAGRLELGTINQEAWCHFELGQEYYIIFEKAENKD